MNMADNARVEALQRQFDRVVQAYFWVGLICWSIFSIFAAAHAVLVYAVTQSRTLQGNIEPRIAVSLTGIGVLAATAWVYLLWRTRENMRLYVELMAELEKELVIIDEKFGMTRQRNPALHDRVLGRYWKAQDVMQWCTVLTWVGWVVSLVYFVCHWR
jgi:hypothetical protein